MQIAQMLALAMLLGSIPVAELSTRRGRLGVWLLPVLALDVATGFAPVCIAHSYVLSRWLLVSVGLVAILSHSFPYWLMFRPSRFGLAAAVGVVFGANPIAGLLALAAACAALTIARNGMRDEV